MRPASTRSDPGINKVRLCVGVLLCLGTVLTAALAQTEDVWLGGQAKWSDASKWSNGVPNGNFDVFIDNDNPAGSLVLLDINPTVANLTIDSDDVLYVAENASNTVSGGTIVNHGVIFSGTGHRHPGALTLATNAVTNQGTLFSYGQLFVNAALTNQGTIEAPLVRTGDIPYVEINGSLTNTGKIEARKGGRVRINGPFSNFSGTALTGGTYIVAGGILQFTDANIVTNSATVYLGSSPQGAGQIIDQSGNNALRNFANNTRGSSFTCGRGLSLAVPTDFSNAGEISARCSFQVASYRQTSGVTTIENLLTAPSGMTIDAGVLSGGGNIHANVVSSGSVTPSPGGTNGQPRSLGMSAYTQTASGTLNITIAGDTSNSKLAVANGVSLNGILKIHLRKNFVPAIGSTFTILTGSAVTGQFAIVKGLSITSNEHFQITYNPTSVTLTVVSGAD